MTLFSDNPSSAKNNLDEQSALIALSMVPNIGPSRLRRLIHRFGSAQEVMALPPQTLTRVDGVGTKTAQAICGFNEYERVQEQIQRAARLDAELVPLADQRFPVRLREIFDPPPFLWKRGRLTAQDDPAVAVVGTRKASKYGKQVAYDLAKALAKRQVTVVSGLAYGIDTAAHKGALKGGGRTLAVLGSGVDWIYPAANTGLARRIIRQGALLSEYPMGEKPEAGNFPRRNRLISGITVGTVVVESKKKGGALITAYLALEQNREVFAVPGSIFRSTASGTHGLIQKGHAKLVANVEDIMEELEPFVRANPLDERKKATNGDSETAVKSLNRIEKKLYEALSKQPVHIDALCRQTNIDPSTALVYLLSMEFKGLVRQMAGKQFYRA